MPTRRAILGGVASAPLLGSSLLRPARAATPASVVVMAKQIDDVLSFDPAEAFEFTDNEVCGNIYQTLCRPDLKDPNRILPDLAASWETSADGLTTTFRMKPGQVFASGNPVTAADVVYTLVRAVKLDKAPVFILNQFGLTKDNVDAMVRATDPMTVSLTIAQPMAPSFLFYCLSANVGSIVDSKLVQGHAEGDDFGNKWLRTASAGSGDWTLRSWKPSDSIVIERNPKRTAAGLPTRMIIRHVPEPSAQLLLLQRGDADIVRDLTPDQLKGVREATGGTVVSATAAFQLYLAMNQKNPNLAKPQVWRAIKWAIDYTGIQTNILGPTWTVRQAIIPKGIPGAIDDAPFRRDVAKAKQLLAEAGVPNGFKVSLDYYSAAPYGDIAAALQNNLAAIGIELSMQAGEQKQVISKTRARQHELALLSWGSDYFDPNSNAQAFAENQDNGDTAKLRTVAWRSGWQSKSQTDLALAAVRERDSARRLELYAQLQRDCLEGNPFCMLMQQVVTAVQAKGVSGFELGVLNSYTNYSDVRKS